MANGLVAALFLGSNFRKLFRTWVIGTPEIHAQITVHHLKAIFRPRCSSMFELCFFDLNVTKFFTQHIVHQIKSPEMSDTDP